MKTVRYFTAILALALVSFGMTSCTGSYGKKLEFNKGELYYTSNVTEEEAKKLGNFLVKEEFFNGDKKSVQLDKANGTYEFRMVTQKGKENDPQMADLAKAFAQQMSKDLFGGAETVVHLCDENLKTLKVVTMH